jgi:hypothetical protein
MSLWNFPFRFLSHRATRRGTATAFAVGSLMLPFAPRCSPEPVPAPDPAPTTTTIYDGDCPSCHDPLPPR